MEKIKAIKKLEEQLTALANLPGRDLTGASFQKWKRDTALVIRHAFGKAGSHSAEFFNIRWVDSNLVFDFPEQRLKTFRDGCIAAHALLCSMIDELKDYWPDNGLADVVTTTAAKPAAPTTRDVFVVHGRDDACRETVARFLEKLKLSPIILHEQASGGKTIIEKFEAHAGVAFAVVLLTADDRGGIKDLPPDKQQPRARQNVILELGYFLARLGRQRVCALHEEGVEIPSDYAGVVYVPLDKAGGWKMTLAREIKGAGLDVDVNKAL